ncbi:hypothetical protein MAM1_0196d07776 [Mucor ambiguus]|uniref:Uncharacterized protein n=1 Tax=Mucor ambiguus TaxID=91626 RepID=A0A0C9N139_9FUNG|nr:hypothetical protein MAM1_0196d07776 [Mucor ambiguus]
MMEIDIVKASANKPIASYYDDTDISETDTALNTPTGSLTDAFVKRFSSTSSSCSSYNAMKRKPSITPSNNNKASSPELLQRIQALEMEVNQLVENEINLKSQLLVLKQQQQQQGKQSALDRIHRHIDRFLASNQQQKGDKNASDLSGIELPTLFDENDANVDQVESGVTSVGDTTHYPAIDIPSVLILRLKAMIDHFMKNKGGEQEDGKGETSFCTELLSTLDTWQSYQFSAILNQQLEQKKEQDRVTRLLAALHKSLLRNKIMQKDMNLLTKQYKYNLKSILKDQEQQQHYQKPAEKKRRTSIAASAVSHDHCEKTRLLLECQIQNLEMALRTCQDELDEHETTLEMVRREMETMLEELEDTRQQRLRYKTQASRLRAGLEAIQKKKKKTSAHHGHEDQDDDEEEEEDEATEAIRLMYNEAERQAVDLDRECKRQALTLESIRKELKLTEEKYQAMKAEKNKQTKIVEQSNRNLTRRIEMLELQLETNSKSDISIPTTKNSTEQRDDSQNHEHDQEEHLLLYHAKIHALQIALKAAKSDAIVQRTRIYQLERQSMLDPAHYVIQMENMFKKELAVSATTAEPSMDIHQQLADRIEFEQREWKQRQLIQFQKKFDMDLLRVNREILTLSSRLTEIETESDITQSRHKEAMALMRHQINMDFEHKLQKLIALQHQKEQELQDQLEVLYQKNQTLQDESMILYGRNMMMAHRLGKIA